MTRYIDGHHLRTWILARWEEEDPTSAYPLKAGDILDQIDREMEYPTVDAIEVVRCKDCKWGKEVCGNIECWIDMNLPPEYHGYDWYCPNGERKEE